MSHIRSFASVLVIAAVAGCAPRSKTTQAVEHRGAALTALHGVVDVSAGVNTVCAVLDTGHVACWGDASTDGSGNFFPSAVPVVVAGVSDATAVEVSQSQVCALRMNGGVTCWGDGIDPDTGSDIEHVPGISPTPTDVPGVSNAIAVSGGKFFSCALLGTGGVVCWGQGFLGTLGDGTGNNSGTPVAVANLTGASAIASAGYHSCALRTDGSVMCWGSGGLGGGSDPALSAELVQGLPAAAVAISAGRENSCARHANGTISCWGDNGNKQLGPGPISANGQPTLDPNVSDATFVLSGNHNTCVIHQGGTVSCWGGGAGLLGNGSFNNSSTPVPVAGLSNVVHLTGGGAVNCALRDTGEVLCWGDGTVGDLGNGESGAMAMPVAVNAVNDAVPLAMGDEYVCSIRRGGALLCWGGHLPGLTIFPETWGIAGAPDASLIAAYERQLCAARANGDVDCWVVLDQATSATSTIAGITNPGAISVGAFGGCGIVSGGQVACWGTASMGELGNGSLTFSSPSAAVMVSGISGAVALGSGANHTCVVLISGQVACWGSNSSGELGLGSISVGSAAPVTVSGISDAVTVAGGFGYSCAIRQNGHVSCWGQDIEGQLGDGQTTDSLIPVDAAGVTDALAFASVADDSVCVALRSGGVSCWGRNTHGQLGRGIFGGVFQGVSSAASPAAVIGVTDAVTAVSGPANACALRTTGEVACWGDDFDSQLGWGHPYLPSMPVNVLGLSTSAPCASNDECATGFCVDGVCCASACGGSDPSDCQACSVAAGGTTDGVCTTVTQSSAHVCRPALSVCDVAETCDGVGMNCPQDVLGTPGTLCAVASQVCEGPATCTAGNPQCPANPFTPGQQCSMSTSACLSDAVCVDGSYSCPAPVPLVPPEMCGQPDGSGTVHLPSNLGPNDIGVITLTFTGLGGPADVALVETTDGPLPRSGYQVINVGETRYYYVSTTAAYTSVQVCVNYDPDLLTGPEANTYLEHWFGNGSGENMSTEPPDTVNHRVCIDVTSLSPFAVVVPLPSSLPRITVPQTIVAAATSLSGAKVDYKVSASDAQGALLTPTCMPSSGSTFPLGTTTVHCNVTDAHGFVAQASFKVWVQYHAPSDGTFFLQPINPDGSSIFKRGSTIPVKFQLTGLSAGITNAVARLYLAQVSNAVTGTLVEAVSSGAADAGNRFRFDGSQYIYNLSTKSLATGTWSLKVDLGDGVARSVNVSLR